MPVEISKKLLKRLQDEAIVWLTTVRSDGTPQPAPVWFLWDGETFLIFSQPGARKVGNIRGNAKVAVNLNSDEYGGSVAVFWGKAVIEAGTPPAAEMKAYVEKYRQGIKDIGLTPESMAAEYSVPIRIKPERVRQD